MPSRKSLESLLGSANVQKFLNLISQTEGTDKNGYATAFGGGQLPSLNDHPRQLHSFKQTDGKSNKTSAAGRYQFLTKTWDGLKKQYDLKDFGARSQDIAALGLIAGAGALDHVLKGDFTNAIKKTGGIWASLPSSPYAQPKKSWNQVDKMLGGSGGGGGGGAMTTKGGNTAAFVADARKQGFSDADIYAQLTKSTKFQQYMANARKQGYSPQDAVAHFGLSIEAPAKKPFVAIDPRAEAEKTVAKQAGATPAWQGALLGASDLGAGITQGFNWLGDRAGEGINALLGTNIGTGNYDAFNQQRNDATRFYEQRREQAGQGFDLPRLGGAIGSTIPLTIATGGSSSLGQLALQGGALGFGIGGASYAPNAQQRLTNATIGAGGGAGGAALGKGISTAVTKSVNAATGRMAPAAQEISDLGKQYSVRTSVADLSRNPTARRTEKVLDQIPIVGTGGFRAGQQAEVRDASGRVLQKLQNAVKDTDYKNINALRQAATNGDKNALRIIDIVNSTGDDTGKILQASAEIKSWRGQKVAEKLYDKVGGIAGNNPITPASTIRAIDDVIAKDSKVAPNDDLLNAIGSIRSKLDDPSININFGELRAARSRLGELVDEWGRQGKSTSGLTQIRSAIEKDISDFANQSGNPQLVQAYRRADSYYKSWQQGKAKGLAQSLRSNEPDRVYDTFIKSGSADKAANFYSNLDPKGQAALRFEMANRAIDKATKENGGVFSPATFAGEFQRMREPYSSIFKGKDKAEMDGFVKLMRHTERAGQYAENPTNGSMLLLPAGGVGLASTALTNPVQAAAGVGSVYALSKLLTTNAGKRILLAANDSPAGSVKLDNLLKMAQSLSTTTGANVGKEK